MKDTRTGKRMLVWLMTAVLLLGIFGGTWADALSLKQPEKTESGTLQVLLKSLGDVSSIRITLNGSYSLNENTGFRFDEKAVVKATAAGDEVWLDCGGIMLNMGESVTLTRHQKSGLNGLYIEGSQRGKLYCGSLRLSAASGVLRVVLLIDVEEYLYGVVPYEMNDAFPLEALKAQAVAARTYALKRRADRGGRDYDVVDTTADQVFMGFDPAYVNVIAAVDATKGICGMYKGSYATCYYTASNGGQTAMANDILGTTGDDGYLAIVDDPYDVENPKSIVRSLVLREDAYQLPALIEKQMEASAAEWLGAMNYSEEAEDIYLDRIISVTPHTTLHGEPNRMYQYVQIEFTVSACPMVPVYSQPTNIDKIHALFGRNTYEPKLLGEEPGDPVLLEQIFTCDIGVYDQLKDQLNMKISNIDCELTTVTGRQGAECEEFVIELRRYGHGVGMSQRGAQWMAGQYQKTFTDILTFYYPGMSFERKQFSDDTLAPISQLPAGVAMSGGEATRSQPELPKPKLGEYYAVVTLSTPWSTLNVRESASTDSRILSTLASGWRVVASSASEGWAYVRTADVEGYVSAQYLTKEK